MKLINYIGNSTKTGIYCIRNLVNGKIYIGSTKRAFHSRKTRHLTSLKRNFHFNEHLQSSYNKYGEESFSFEILLICDPSDCEINEAKYIKEYNSNINKFGYNIASVKEYKFNYKRSEFDSKKQSARKKIKSIIENGLISDEIGLCKPIKVYNLDGSFYGKYSGAMSFCNETGFNRAALCTVLTSRKLYFNKFLIIFENDTLSEEDVEFIRIKKKLVSVSIFYLNGDLFKENLLVKDAAKLIGCQGAEIRMCYTGKRSRIGKYTIKRYNE